MSSWAVQHPLLPVILFAVLSVFGIYAFIKLPISLNPDVSAPFVQVVVSQSGAAPTEIETQILQKLEAGIATVGNVKTITSVALEGLAYATIEFQVGTPVDRAVNDVRDAVARVRADLPEGIQEPQVNRIDISGGPIAYYAINSTGMTEEQLSWFVDDTIAKRLLAVAGVAQVQRSGGVDREIRVDLDPTRLESFGITAAELNQQLRLLNLDATGGRAQVGGGEQAIRVLGGARSAAALGELPIELGAGRTARLRDLATVRDGIAERRNISRLNGRAATTFSVSKSRSASDLSTLDAVEAELVKITGESAQVRLERVFTTVDFTRQSYYSSLEALILGALLAVAIVYVFLRDWRATVIAAVAIPLSALPTFACMQLLGFSLNQLSLLALSLVTGVLVDDAIVEIENISRHMKGGKSAYRAAMEAADEIALAVVATSMTIIAVFFPVAFMGGLIGQFFQEFGLTVAISVFFSLLVARLITPVMAAYMLKPHAALRSADGPTMQWYLKALRWSVQHRWKTVMGGVAFFIASVAGLAVVPTEFVPTSDFSSSTLNLELPPGVPLAQTAAASADAYAILRRRPEVKSVVESVGNGDEVRTAQLYVSLVPPGERTLSQEEWENEVIEELRLIPDVRLYFQSQSDGTGRDLTKYVVGSDPVAVQQAARQMVEEMRGLTELIDPRINGDYRRPELIIRPRGDIAAELGVTVAAISQTVRVATLGDIPQNSARFSLSDRQIPIRVGLIESARRDLSVLQNLPVRTANGGMVPLKAVADISYGEGPARIRRYNQQRRLALDADFNNVERGVVEKKIAELPSFKNPPAGVKVVDIGDSQYQAELFGGFLKAVAVGILMVLAVLVLLFARVFQPITILSALPLSVGGAVLAMLLTGNAFSLATVIGLLMLMGIVGKNSILLVDFAIEEQRAGKDRLTALLEAGHKRARPIIMTTVAMVAGMLPAAMGLGGSGSFQQPMALAVIGGLITSTALTLVIVPASFTIMDDVERWTLRKFGGGRDRVAPTPASVTESAPT